MALKTRYSPLQHLSMDNLFTSFGDLPPKNKIIALSVAGLVMALVLFVPLSLFSSKLKTLKKDIQTIQKGQAQISDKITEYRSALDEVSVLERQFSGGGGSLTSRVDAIARDSGINLDQLKEKAAQETDYLEINSIELKLSNIELSQLMDFLFNLENQKGSLMRVRKIEIKPRRGNPQILDVPSLEVATFNLKKEAS